MGYLEADDQGEDDDQEQHEPLLLNQEQALREREVVLKQHAIVINSLNAG